MLDDSKDAGLRASGLQEAGAIILEVLMDTSHPRSILHSHRPTAIILVVGDPVLLFGETRALVELRATVSARTARVLLEEDVVGGPNERGRLAGSQLRLDLVHRNSGVVDPRRRFGVQDGVHQRIRCPLLKTPLLLLHYQLLVSRRELLLIRR